MRTTNQAVSRTALLLTLVVLLLLPIATGIGMFVPAFYRDTAWMIPQARGQDLVTLAVVEPLLIMATLAALRGHMAARLLWIGTLGYVLYTYAMYSYTTYFNALFLVYVALFSASLFALIALLVHLDAVAVWAAIRPGIPTRITALYCALIGLFFMAAWLGQIVPATLRGSVPESIVLARTPTSAVHVQDLAVVLPLFFVAAVWLWQRRPWGVVLGAILLVVADVMLIALLSMSAFSAQAGVAGALDMTPAFTLLALASLGITVLFFGHIKSPSADAATDADGSAPSTAQHADAMHQLAEPARPVGR